MKMKVTRANLKKMILSELQAGTGLPTSGGHDLDPPEEEELDDLQVLARIRDLLSGDPLGSRLEDIINRLKPESEYFDEPEEEHEPTTRTPVSYGGEDWEPTMGFRENKEILKNIIEEEIDAVIRRINK
jgi:hypothetical protein